MDAPTPPLNSRIMRYDTENALVNPKMKTPIVDHINTLEI